MRSAPSGVAPIRKVLRGALAVMTSAPGPPLNSSASPPTGALAPVSVSAKEEPVMASTSFWMSSPSSPVTGRPSFRTLSLVTVTPVGEAS